MFDRLFNKIKPDNVSEVNKDRLIDFVEITDFKSKTQKAMKELTKFDIK